MSYTIMIGPPFLVSGLCPFENRKIFLYSPLLSNLCIYLHDALQVCVSGQDNMPHIIMVTFRCCFFRFIVMAL